jgi:hypothetical protein
MKNYILSLFAFVLVFSNTSAANASDVNKLNKVYEFWRELSDLPESSTRIIIETNKLLNSYSGKVDQALSAFKKSLISGSANANSIFGYSDETFSKLLNQDKALFEFLRRNFEFKNISQLKNLIINHGETLEQLVLDHLKLFAIRSATLTEGTALIAEGALEKSIAQITIINKVPGAARAVGKGAMTVLGMPGPITVKAGAATVAEVAIMGTYIYCDNMNHYDVCEDAKNRFVSNLNGNTKKAKSLLLHNENTHPGFLTPVRNNPSPGAQ